VYSRRCGSAAVTIALLVSALLAADCRARAEANDLAFLRVRVFQLYRAGKLEEATPLAERLVAGRGRPEATPIRSTLPP